MALILTGCTSKSPASGKLRQRAPRAVTASMNLPDHTETGFVIAGLEDGAVPQGITLIPTSSTVITSHYFPDQTASCLVLSDWNTGKAFQTQRIINPDGTLHTGHVGGITADKETLWIASDGHLYRGNLTDPAAEHFQTLEKIKTEATEEAAFCSLFDGQVWVGEFSMGNKFQTHPAHQLTDRTGGERGGWVCGYNPDTGFDHPKQILSIPDRSQGIHMTRSHIFLSRSYGRRNRSTVEVYSNPLSEPAHRNVLTSKNHKAPLWFLDEENHIRTIDLPPMAENITARDQHLLILFESGAKKFRFFGKKPVDYLILLQPEELK